MNEDPAFAVMQGKLILKACSETPLSSDTMVEIVKDKKKEKKHIILWIVVFSVIGVIAPITCLFIQFQFKQSPSQCFFWWPMSLMLCCTRFDPVLYSISIALNAGLWAVTGWLFGFAYVQYKK